jgi:copper chaperone CopZ
MSVALHLYQQLRDAPDDDSRAKAIAEAFEQFEERYPNLKEIATQSQLRETELRLLKEIKEVEAKIKEVDGKVKEVELSLQAQIKEVDGRVKAVELSLQKQIREVELSLQKEIKEVELRLLKEIKEVEGKIKDVEGKIKDAEVRLNQAIHRQTLWIVGSVGTIFGFIRLLDWFLAHVPN